MSKDKGITLHPEYGANPSLLQCFLCGADYGVALLGRNRGEKAPHRMSTFDSICDTCEKHMKMGIILIEVRDGESGPNPYRTGRQWVVTEEAIKKIFDAEAAERVLKSRAAFVEKTFADQLGLADVKPVFPDGVNDEH